MPDDRRPEAFGAVGENDGGPRSAGDPAAGQLIAGRYRLLDRLGSGAMADVYRAHDETLDRNVAIKMFRAVMDGGDTAGDARRELELQALAQLSHPNLITLFDGSVTDDDPSFLALELVQGPTLAAVLRDGALAEPQVRRIGEQIAGALAYVHERGMVHRDVKPANILLGRDSAADPTSFRARLSDFGIVRLVDSAQVTAADLTVGTAYYLAPEQARSAAVGPAADVYALGLVLLEALTGARAFEGAMHEVLVARLNRDPEIPADLPEPWPGLLRAMTAQHPDDRPAAAEVVRVLRESAATGAGLPLSAAGAGAGLAGLGLAGAAGAVTPDAPTAAAAPAQTAAAPVAGAAGTAGAAAAPAAAPAAAAAAPAAFGAADPFTPTGAGPGGPPAGGESHDVAAAEPPARHHMTGMLVAAAAFLLIIGGAGWLIFKPTSGAGPGQGQFGPSNTGVTSSSTSRGTSSSPVAGSRHDAQPVTDRSPVGGGGGGGGGPALRRSTHAVGPGTPHPTRGSARPSTSSSSQPSTSAAPSSSASSTSAPPSSSSHTAPSPSPSTTSAPSTPSSTTSSATAATSQPPAAAPPTPGSAGSAA